MAVIATTTPAVSKAPTTRSGVSVVRQGTRAGLRTGHWAISPISRSPSPRATSTVCRSTTSGGSKNVAVEAAVQYIEDGWTYLDVRTQEEFAEARVADSVNVPVFISGSSGMETNPEFISTVMEKFPGESTKILMGCRSGQRSQAAIQLLLESGCAYEMVNVEGGILSWAAAGLPLDSAR